MCLALRAVPTDRETVIMSKDTDVLVLLVWAFNKLNIKRSWLLKYDYEKFVDIGGIYKVIW